MAADFKQVQRCFKEEMSSYLICGGEEKNYQPIDSACHYMGSEEKTSKMIGLLVSEMENRPKISRSCKYFSLVFTVMVARWIP